MFFMNEMQSATDVDDLVSGIKRATSKHPEGSTLLFDEIEKAHKAIVDVFLSLLDEGQVTDSSGERTSIRNCYVVLTSNIGQRPSLLSGRCLAWRRQEHLSRFPFERW
jgi:ATP-dependent Clp protease ATP-binding subunit ClpA